MGVPLVIDLDGLGSTTWLGLGLLLTLCGALASVLVWRRRGPGRGLRVLAWSLVPLAAALVGLLELAGDVVDSVASWATDLVLRPSSWVGAWAGLSLVVLAVLLHAVGGYLIRREDRRGGRSAPVTAGKSPRGVGTGSTQPATAAPTRGKGKVASSSAIEGQDDIEAILRKHGIT